MLRITEYKALRLMAAGHLCTLSDLRISDVNIRELLNLKYIEKYHGRYCGVTAQGLKAIREYEEFYYRAHAD